MEKKRNGFQFYKEMIDMIGKGAQIMDQNTENHEYQKDANKKK